MCVIDLNQINISSNRLILEPSPQLSSPYGLGGIGLYIDKNVYSFVVLEVVLP